MKKSPETGGLPRSREYRVFGTRPPCCSPDRQDRKTKTLGPIPLGTRDEVGLRRRFAWARSIWHFIEYVFRPGFHEVRQQQTFENGQEGSHWGQEDCAPVKPFAYCLYRPEPATDRCTACGTVESCPLGYLHEGQQEELRASFRTSGTYRSGERIHRRGSKAAGLSIVAFGSVKLETCTRDGRRIVNGFHFPDDLIGGDSIGAGIHPADVIALEETRLCTLAASDIERFCGRFPEFQRFLLCSLSNELRKEKYVCTSLRQLPSVDRTLAFFHDMNERFGPANRTAGKLCLPMKKQDIAAYLGLTSETLSRNLKYLERRSIIKNAADGITLLQRP